MKATLLLAVTESLACAVPHNPGGSSSDGSAGTPVSAVSYNRSDVDVYLLCGDHEAVSLGLLPAGGYQALDIPPDKRTCAAGLNFFLVVREVNRGYWVGPFRVLPGSLVRLVVEKYAGLSTASLQRD
jgi:hypothetical protein